MCLLIGARAEYTSMRPAVELPYQVLPAPQRSELCLTAKEARQSMSAD